ncbi:MAG: Secretion system C-terminal sorting domain [Bacteroidota bacterium]|jgi:hypothetical protein
MKKMKFTATKAMFLLFLTLFCSFGATAQYLLRENIVYYWNNNAWLEKNQNKYEYHTSGALLNKIKAQYYNNWTNGAWVKGAQALYSYDLTNLKPILFAYTGWNGTAYDIPYYRVKTTYTTIGMNTERTETIETGGSGIFKPEDRYTYLLDPAGNELMVRWERIVNNNFKTIAEFNWTYNNNQKTTGTYLRNDYNTGNFESNVKVNYLYDSQGNLKEEIEQVQFGTTTSFTNSKKDVYTYLNNKLDKLQQYGWDTTTNTWSLGTTNDYIYILNTTTRTISSSGINNQKIITTEGVLSKQKEEVINQSWTDNTWKNTVKEVYIYDKFVATNDQTIEKTINLTLFPNPTTDNIQLKDLELDAPTLYQIYDALGRVVLQGTLLSSNDAVFIRHLGQGNYVFLLKNKGISKFVKQ